MFCSKHVDVKRHSVCFPEIEKTFAISSLVLNLFPSQIGEFFLPHPVYDYIKIMGVTPLVQCQARSKLVI